MDKPSHKCFRFIFVLIFTPVFQDVIATDTTQNSIVRKSEVFESGILHKKVNYSLYFSKDINTIDTIPVIYLFYGLGGNENSWLNRDNVRYMLDSLQGKNLIPPFIAVMPNAKNTYCINNADGSYRYQDFFIHELIPAIDSMYHTNCTKKYRAIGGLSMGGYGAVINTMQFPDLFGTCINLSGAIRTDSMLAHVSDGFYGNFFEPVFGAERLDSHWINHNPYHIMNDSLATQLKSIHWYNDCGLNDYLLPANKAFHELLSLYKVPHEFHIRIGKHEWEYWRSSLIDALIFWGEQLK